MFPWINLEFFFNLVVEFFKVGLNFLEAVANKTPINTNALKTISIIISAILLAGIIYVIAMIVKLNKKSLKDAIDFTPQEESQEERTNRWAQVKKHLQSSSSAEWKLAIIEADSILDDIIAKIGIKGNNFGERLKNMEQSGFENLQNAWEAHKTRNKIAHEGYKFHLTREEAERAISLFEKSLKEFKYI